MERLVISTTTKCMADACAALERSVAEHGFGVLHIHRISDTLARKGFSLEGDVRVYDVCNPQRAKEVLERNPLVAAALPCGIAVIREGPGAKFVFLRPTAVLGLFDDGELYSVAREVEATVTAIVEEAAQ